MPESAQTIKAAAPPGQSFEKRYSNSYEVISLVAYLIGVERRHFEPDYEPPKLEAYEALEKDKDARIIRNLCRIRTAFEKNFSNIYQAFRYDLKNIGSCQPYIPPDAVNQLYQDGIQLQKSRPDCNEYLIAINREISNRINNVKRLFPEWLNWDYIRQLFIMPNGQKVEGLKAAFKRYNDDRNRYPYQCYINWDGTSTGNLLFRDEKFVQLLYESHQDYFSDRSLLRGASENVLNNITSFIMESDKALVVVDCENSNPVKLAAALSSLPSGSLAKIQKVLLFGSDYTTTAWQVLSGGAASVKNVSGKWNILNKVAAFPIEYVNVPRLIEKKSQVDMTLATATCREVYRNGIDSVILVSSDSDYWALINSLSDIKFLVMMERSKCGKDIKEALDARGMWYCFLDDFYAGASYTIKTTAVLDEVQRRVDSVIGDFNIKTMFEDALHDTWVPMTEKEQLSFYNRYLKNMKLTIAQDGTVSIQLSS